MSTAATQDFVVSYAVEKTSRAHFSQALDDHTDTGLSAPLGANLNLNGAPDPVEALKTVQLRINELEKAVNVQAGVINLLIDVLQAAGLAE